MKKTCCQLRALIVILGALASNGIFAAEAAKSDGSDLGITIMGSIVQKSIDDNVALIKEENGSVRAVKKDHVILSKYKVLVVHERYIELINREAKHFIVYQDKFGGNLSSKTAVASQSNLSGAGEVYREEGFERVKGKIAMTAMYRDKLVKEDMAKILMQATAEPYMENGAIVGFKLSQIDEGSIFMKSGVMEEDIITAVNGHELNSIAGSISLLQSLKGTDSVEIDVRRGGVAQKITISVN